MKDIKELSRLVADMVCKSFEEIIDENINPDAIVNTCKVDSEFKDSLIDKLSQAFPILFQGDVNHDSVVNYLKDVERSELCDILNESDKMSEISEELQDDIVDDWFENADASDITNRCSSSQELDLEDYFLDNFKERAKDAIENM